MAQVNLHYRELPGTYLFVEVEQRVEAHLEKKPDAKIIRMGVGDVALPLAPKVVQAMEDAVKDLASGETFVGYGPAQGHVFLREAIAKNDFGSRGVDIDIDEIFVSDGAKTDCSNIGGLFHLDCKVAVCDPVYPVYVDANAMVGRAGEYNYETGQWTKLHYMPTTPENDFCPDIPEGTVDMIYLCSPSNPTGTVLTKDQLKAWVDYANDHDSVILFDAAYERFITDDSIPHSIFEIEGAKTCAIEFRSFSKTAGFTGVRCGYIVIPKELIRSGESLNAMWRRRQSTKFNGASYLAQRGAEAIYTEEGAQQIEKSISYYQENARLIKEGLEAAGLTVYGAVNSPYIWCKTPDGMNSWDFFDLLLNEADIITTPGSGFGPHGEGFVRITAFGQREEMVEAVTRIQKLLASA